MTLLMTGCAAETAQPAVSWRQQAVPRMMPRPLVATYTRP
jgi:hypothetical protein